MTDEEKTIPIRMAKKGDSVMEIMQALQRSETDVRKAIKAFLAMKKNETRGRSPKLRKMMVQRIIRKGSKGDKDASDIRAEVEGSVKVRRVQQILHESKWLNFKKAVTGPAMTQEHKDLRASWAREAITSAEIDWTRVVFYDEKRFNIDRPSGSAYYWSDFCIEELYFPKH